jgi:hypothetical protein
MTTSLSPTAAFGKASAGPIRLIIITATIGYPAGRRVKKKVRM